MATEMENGHCISAGRVQRNIKHTENYFTIIIMGKIFSLFIIFMVLVGVFFKLKHDGA